MGMCCAADLAVALKILRSKDAVRIKNLIALYGLPTKVPADIDVLDIVNAMETDKKARAGKLRFVLPESIGRVRIEEDVDREIIKKVLTSLSSPQELL